MHRLRYITAIALLLISSAFIPTAADEPTSGSTSISDTSTETPALITPVNEKRAKKLARSAEKSLKRIKQNGDYIRHRIINLDMSVLSRRDPIPVYNYEDGVDRAWKFELSFTPFEGERYRLVNRLNYINDVSGLTKTHWVGEIRSEAGELLGIFSIGDVHGEVGGSSYFSFFNGDHYAFRDLGKKKEKVLYQRTMYPPEKASLGHYQNRGDNPFKEVD